MKTILLILTLVLAGCGSMKEATDHPWFTGDGTTNFFHSHCARSQVGLQGQGIRVGGGVAGSLDPSRTISWQEKSPGNNPVVTTELIKEEIKRKCGTDAMIHDAVKEAVKEMTQ